VLRWDIAWNQDVTTFDGRHAHGTATGTDWRTDIWLRENWYEWGNVTYSLDYIVEEATYSNPTLGLFGDLPIGVEFNPYDGDNPPRLSVIQAGFPTFLHTVCLPAPPGDYWNWPQFTSDLDCA